MYEFTLVTFGPKALLTHTAIENDKGENHRHTGYSARYHSEVQRKQLEM